MCENKGIVLNRMYTGSYLSGNLGHEVINMFQAEDDKHYLYLNSKGNFSSRGKNMGTMLLVMGIGDKQVEVVGMAKNLTPVESACCKLPRDLGRVNKPVHDAQMRFIENIKYGKKSIKEIFGDEGQQSVFVSYVTDNESFYKPRKRIVINFGAKDENADVNLSINFASSSLHQFIESDSAPQDWQRLQDLCADQSLWELDNTKVHIPDGFTERQDSLFDICRIQDDENRFSNALSYFIDKYPKVWIGILQTKPGGIKLSKIDSVSREEDAKVEGDKLTGGRIDLLIRTPECYIVIENKIDSGIIIENGISQIERYYNYVMSLKNEEISEFSEALSSLSEQKAKKDEQYNLLKNKEGVRGAAWKKELEDLTIQIDGLYKDRSQVQAREFRGIVLCPDYNCPKPEQLKVGNYTYEQFLYSELYDLLIKNASEELASDSNFRAFHEAMKKHTCITKSEALYEDMKTRFYARIHRINQTK